MALKQEVVPAKSAKSIEKEVDEGKHYNIIVQLGAYKSWRRFRGGRWMPNPENNTPGNLAYKHVPRTHKVGPLSGRIVNGLIAEHNRWIKCNEERLQPDGDVGRMLLVTGIEETKPPRLKARAMPFDMEAVVSKAAETAATAAVKAFAQQRGATSK